MGQLGFFDADRRLAAISAKGDPLEMIDRVVPFESFRAEIEAVVLTPEENKKSKAGRKPIDVIVMFRMLVLQSLYNLSDEQVEYQVSDRMSFARFLRLGLEDRVPDGTTLWLFRETLAKSGLIEKLFKRIFSHSLSALHLRFGKNEHAMDRSKPRREEARIVDFKQLTYFVAVVEAKGFTHASEMLHVAQPALSQHIQKLEYELGQRLMVRHSRGAEPTEAGLRFLAHAKSILQAIETAKQDLKGFHSMEQARVRLGMPRSLCESLGLALLRSWQTDHPNIKLSVVEHLSNTLTEWLVAGRLDLALTYSPFDQNRITYEPLLRERLCAVMPPTASAQRLGEIGFAQLAKLPLILNSARYVNRQIVDSAARYCSIKLNVLYEVDSIDLALNMVESGLGYSIQPFLTVRRLIASGRLSASRIVGPEIVRRLHLAYPTESPLSSAQVQVCDVVKEHLTTELAGKMYTPLIDLEIAPTVPMDATARRRSK